MRTFVVYLDSFWNIYCRFFQLFQNIPIDLKKKLQKFADFFLWLQIEFMRWNMISYQNILFPGQNPILYREYFVFWEIYDCIFNSFREWKFISTALNYVTRCSDLKNIRKAGVTTIAIYLRLLSLHFPANGKKPATQAYFSFQMANCLAKWRNRLQSIWNDDGNNFNDNFLNGYSSVCQSVLDKEYSSGIVFGTVPTFKSDYHNNAGTKF